ncbi:MAG: M48 family metalloprotease [Gammaproteobacteria bacterium]|nr:M48 family metalloprotease [Gammaproteobacteria bacterium]MBU1553548.1 M48 family metalloprotease [Gammaproteobacteria bacterium]MBU2069108.1 M48 family metalloprotease [Gammaproteobacteria bacterium]MBU2182637.1 M48 family metalloprotease [Gammaproteobacteria bacterium]MBU2206564.1 M48 family metalloprotease [Gammaproteobacteria bacterium]
MTISRTELRERFAQLAQNAEYQLSVSPQSYKQKVLWLGVLGYAVIGVLFMLILGAIGGSVWLATLGTVMLIMLIKSKLILLLLAVIWFLFKAVWVKLSAPQGYELSKADFPALWQEVTSLQKTLATPLIHRIVLQPEMNAAIAQTPRLGLFGWHKNTLVVGLELLLALSPDEGKAVLAHEMGHLSGSHAKFSGWVYRIRQSWQRIDDALQQQQSMITTPLRRFFSWYALTFSGYTFALARYNEYEADKISAEIVGAQATASALCHSRLLNQALQQEFWCRLWSQADSEQAPPADAYQQLAAFIQQRRQQAQSEELTEALAEAADADDTHPSLRQRLQALGLDQAVLLSTNATAAERYLGNQLPLLLQYYNEQWQQAVTESWQQQYAAHQQAAADLAALSQTDSTAFSLEQALVWLNSTNEFPENSSARSTLQLLQQRFNDNPDLAFVFACQIKATDPNQAERLFVQVSNSFDWREAALQQLLQMAQQQQNADAKQHWQTTLDNHYDHCETLANRWHNLSAQDLVQAPQLSAKELGLLQLSLSKVPALKSAVLAKRKLPPELSEPSYILYITARWYRSNGDSLMQKVADKLGGQFPVFVINKDFVHKDLRNKVKSVGQQVYNAD